MKPDTILTTWKFGARLKTDDIHRLANEAGVPATSNRVKQWMRSNPVEGLRGGRGTDLTFDELHKIINQWANEQRCDL